MRYFSLQLVLCLSILVSCNPFSSNIEADAIARVNDNFLYKDALIGLVPDNASKTDSMLIVNSYINRWASELLIMDKALINLPEKQHKTFNNLVDQYKTDLYTKAYLDALVERSVDTTILDQEAERVYIANKESFKLNDELVQFRYISLPQNALNIEATTERFRRFNTKDKVHLDSISLQFISYSLNDSIWIRLADVLQKVPVLNGQNKNQLLKKSNFIRLKDSLNLYLMQTNNVLLRNDYAPLEYVKATINQIIINKRKLELIRQIEKDITKDAIKNKQFEVYK